MEFSLGFRSDCVRGRETGSIEMGRSEFSSGIDYLNIGIGGTIDFLRHLQSVPPACYKEVDSHSFYPLLKLLHPLLQKLINYQLELEVVTCLKSV